MILLHGTQKQIKFANDIKSIVINTLKAHKEVNRALEEHINRAIEDIEHITDAGFIINQLKEVCYTKKHNERMAIIIEYMCYSASPAYWKLVDNIDKDIIDTIESLIDKDYDMLLKLRYIY